MTINNTATMPQTNIDFRSAYCRVHNCSPEEFTRRVFRKALHLRSWPVAGLLGWLYPRFFRNDLMLVDEVALATSRNQCLVALQGYRQDCHMSGGFFHNKFRFRISGKRLLALYDSTFDALNASMPGESEAATPPGNR